jgi:hypothetical protein
MVRALTLIVATAAASCLAQDPTMTSLVGRADLVVIGTMHRDFRFLWIERGHIDVEGILKGSVQQTILPFAWEDQSGWCLSNPDWRHAVDKRGIWVLTRGGYWYRAPDIFGGFLGLKYLEEVRETLAGIHK